MRARLEQADVFIMGNIHAGEVEGKEAMLHFRGDTRIAFPR